MIEIPRDTKAKLEISKEEEFNPIKQDVKAGKLRFVEGPPSRPGGYMWNYGAFPQVKIPFFCQRILILPLFHLTQTWEDPNFKHPETDAFGDKDPLDLCEIGESVATVGEVKQVKVLGVLAMIDEGVYLFFSIQNLPTIYLPKQAKPTGRSLSLMSRIPWLTS